MLDHEKANQQVNIGLYPVKGDTLISKAESIGGFVLNASNGCLLQFGKWLVGFMRLVTMYINTHTDTSCEYC